MASKLKELDEKSFKDFIGKDIVLISFGAPWCHACKQIAPILEEMTTTYKGKVSFAKIDVTKAPGISSRYGVMSLPNILIFKKGKVVDQIIGATTKKKIEEQIKKVIK